jgi:hypothetical protein
MATTIITKYGNGKPGTDDLQHGELAIDMTGSVLYTKDGNDRIIELGGGTVGWDQIDKDTIPPELIAIIDGTIDLDALLELANQNNIDIGALGDDLAELEKRVKANEAAILALQNSVGDLDEQINGDGGIAERLGDAEDDIKENTKQIGINAGNISSNRSEIDALKLLVEGGVTGLTLGGEYNAAQNWVENPTEEGKAVGLLNGQPLPATAGTKGFYVIVTTEGVLSGTGISKANGKSDGETAYPGDWLISDGVHGWVLFEFHTDATVWGQIGGDITNQDDLQEALELKFDKDGGTLECGRY